jgi:asparagine N-glycosylation enzyme membrane subunit Stt3
MKLLESASKLVFLLLTVTACIAFIFGKLPTDSFMILATGAFAFYFSNKGDKSNDYLGK